MFGSLTKIPVRQLKILILNPLSLLVYNKNMSAYYMNIGVGICCNLEYILKFLFIQIESNLSLHFTKMILMRPSQWGL